MKYIKKCFAVLFAAMLCLTAAVRAGARAPEDLASGTAVLMDAQTGQVLYAGNMHQKMYPASMTKIMTALLVIEMCDPDEIVTVSERAVDIDEPDSTNAELRPGERFPVRDGLYALMLLSANDMANALAEHAAGSLEAFAERMNERAAEIGAAKTRFANPHGLHEDGHYTTAYDMALITRHAMQNKDFLEIFGALEYTMPATNLSGERQFHSYQYMLHSESVFYDADVVGGKTGYTWEALHTMSTAAVRADRGLICVVMHSQGGADKFTDTKKLLDFGFDEFYPYTVERGRIAEFQVPVYDGDTLAGSARFSAGAGELRLWLHQSVDASQVQIRYEKPDRLYAQGPIACEAVIEAPKGGANIPSELLRVEMRVYTSITPLPAAAEQWPTLREVYEQLRGLLGGAFAAVLALAAGTGLLCLSALALRRRRIRRRSRRRQARLARRALEQCGVSPRWEYRLSAPAERNRPPAAASHTLYRANGWRRDSGTDRRRA